MPYISEEKLKEAKIYLEFAKKDLARFEKKVADRKSRYELEQDRIRKEHR